jgi:RNA polymerase sigma factor (sigma-70 family)
MIKSHPITKPVADAGARRPHATSTIARRSSLPARHGAAHRHRLDRAQLGRLVAAARRGDHAAWEALVREFGGLVSGIARAHRLDDADVADVAQATWMTLLEHLGDLNDPACIGGWLATTARRECLRVLRRGQRVMFFGSEAPEHEDDDTRPGDGLMAMERDQALWRSFARLRASDQALLRLLMAEPRPPYEEISATLDMPVGSIGPTRARALERLRTELDAEGTLALMTA